MTPLISMRGALFVAPSLHPYRVPWQILIRNITLPQSVKTSIEQKISGSSAKAFRTNSCSTRASRLNWR